MEGTLEFEAVFLGHADARETLAVGETAEDGKAGNEVVREGLGIPKTEKFYQFVEVELAVFCSREERF